MRAPKKKNITVRELIDRHDPGKVGDAINGYPDQIQHILDIYSSWHPKNAINPSKILFLGMGGSAIGGDMVRLWVEGFTSTPMTVNRGYNIPGWVDKDTLVIASSYSGNTEETLEAANKSMEVGATVMVIASGGKLALLATTNGWDNVSIPGGLQPRCAIGYSIAAVACVLVGYDILPAAILAELAAGAVRMRTENEIYANPGHVSNRALSVAKSLIGKLPIIYGAMGTTEQLAVRFRGQLAENGKIFSSHHILPELNHNEIVGLAERIKSNADVVVIWLADQADHERIKLRRQLTGQLLGMGDREIDSNQQGIVLEGHGESLVERNVSLLNLTDWISFYIAIVGEKDPSEIDILLAIKGSLS